MLNKYCIYCKPFAIGIAGADTVSVVACQPPSVPGEGGTPVGIGIPAQVVVVNDVLAHPGIHQNELSLAVVGVELFGGIDRGQSADGPLSI